MSPEADGTIRPVVVPDLPWKQEFEPGERVRVINGAGLKFLWGAEGVVTATCESKPFSVRVEIDGRESIYNLAPGELRRIR